MRQRLQVWIGFQFCAKAQLRRGFWPAMCLVHTSCTTANEAFALEKPAVCFETLPSPLHNYFLSGKLSVIARSENEVLQKVEAILNGKRESVSAQTKTFLEFFAAQSGPFAAQRMVESLSPQAGPAAKHSTWKAGAFFRRRWWPTAFQRRMFPDFSAEVLSARLKQLAAATGVASAPEVHRLGDGLYHVRPSTMALSEATKRRILPFI